ncbi:MAG: nucleotide sugar dehydrogenase [Candidatus Omnitrophica bacterium]|nr:nucleotide sugar dehydrogenase [Candidatus Omnitrophota bacterium]
MRFSLYRDREERMSAQTELMRKIGTKKARICVVGLGYVGLPLAVAFARKGFFVYGLDKKPQHVTHLKKGEQYIVDVPPEHVTSLIRRKKFAPTTDEEVLRDADVIILCVPTPLRKVKLPDVSYVMKASQTVGRYLRPGQLVVLESTSYPTTTREIVLPELKKSGLEEEKDFFLCFSPERVNPGDKKFPLVKITKIVGGLSPRSTKMAKTLYGYIIPKIFAASSPEVAETSKLLENTFRLINIALVNEFAMVCEKLGIRIWEVIEAAKTKPFGYMPFSPGPGIGGHCIPTDPIFLSWKAKKLGFRTKMIDLASFLNREMPRYVVDRVEKALVARKRPLYGAPVLVLGVTYKKDVKDLRESPALEIIEELQSRGAKTQYSDPLLPFLKIKEIDLRNVKLTVKNIKEYACVIIVTDHSAVDYARLQKHAQMIFDTRNVYQKAYENVEVL